MTNPAIVRSDWFLTQGYRRPTQRSLDGHLRHFTILDRTGPGLKFDPLDVVRGNSATKYFAPFRGSERVSDDDKGQS